MLKIHRVPLNFSVIPHNYGDIICYSGIHRFGTLQRSLDITLKYFKDILKFRVPPTLYTPNQIWTNRKTVCINAQPLPQFFPMVMYKYVPYVIFGLYNSPIVKHVVYYPYSMSNQNNNLVCKWTFRHSIKSLHFMTFHISFLWTFLFSYSLWPSFPKPRLFPAIFILSIRPRKSQLKSSVYFFPAISYYFLPYTFYKRLTSMEMPCSIN